MAVTRNPAHLYYLPSDDEWYKAAYYEGGGTNAGYWTYPTRSDSPPSSVLSATGTNNANCYGYYNNQFQYSDPQNFLTAVGAFQDSPGPYGTYDMGGDIEQWMTSMDFRGGSWYDYSPQMAKGISTSIAPTTESFKIGFRVAASEAVPEPSTLALLIVVLSVCWPSLGGKGVSGN